PERLATDGAWIAVAMDGSAALAQGSMRCAVAALGGGAAPAYACGHGTLRTWLRPRHPAVGARDLLVAECCAWYWCCQVWRAWRRGRGLRLRRRGCARVGLCRAAGGRLGRPRSGWWRAGGRA